MNDNCRNDFDVKRKNPFAMPGLIIARSLKELEEKAQQPMVVVASNEYMEGGFSQELFLQWCHEPTHSVILTHRAPTSCLAGKLLNLPKDNRKININYKWKVPLEGEELKRARAKLKADEEAKIVMEQDSEESEAEAPMEVEHLNKEQQERVQMVP